MIGFPHINVFLILVSPFVGSFLALVVHRLPRNEKLIFDRSRCPSCETKLQPVDLLPLLSFAASKGRCRYCNGDIGALYPTIEITAFLTASIGIVLVPTELAWVTILLGWCLLTLSAIDLREYILPDLVTLPLIVFGLAHSALIDPEGLFGHIAGGAVGYISFVTIALMYRRWRRREGLGLGDAKLFAAAGAWLGWVALPAVLLIASVGGLLFALATRKGGARLRERRVPFGPFLAFGFWAVWLFQTTGPFP